ncbi:MAG: hypothetical protein V5A68_02645 [Candidatus Thermoplasmatota archaeon]
MEEVLYNIEIHKDDGRYVGKLFSDMDGDKEFKNEHLEELLRDMTVDMQLSFEFPNIITNEMDGIQESF